MTNEQIKDLRNIQEDALKEGLEKSKKDGKGFKHGVLAGVNIPLRFLIKHPEVRPQNLYEYMEKN